MEDPKEEGSEKNPQDHSKDGINITAETVVCVVQLGMN